ncbi:hypothetical protein OQA88_11349 [Cercophora sp. LCS_1]
MLVQSALLALGASLVSAVPILEAKDNYFWNPKTGNRFQIVGVAYQPGGSAGYTADTPDALNDPEVCLRDAAILQVLGVNAIRVYNLNPDQNHDACASIFNAAGMYMLLDVNSPLVGESLTSHNPWESYYASYLNRTFAIVEAFKNYPNTLAFFSGNEVMNNEETGATVPPYARAMTRDLKNYVANHCDRKIPVGYSAADVRDILWDSFQYFQCAAKGDKSDPSYADLFALNSYSWCGESSYTESGFDQLTAGFKDSSVPVFFSEYGCNTPSPRIFTEVGAIYGNEMMEVFSGGVVYEYTQEANNYGLVNISADGSITLRTDYYDLKGQFAKLDYKKVQGSKPPSGPAPKPPVCESKLITTKGFNSNFTLPVLPPDAPEIIKEGVSPKPSGKLISVSNWTPKYTIRNSDGSEIKSLSVKQLADDQTNEPGLNDADLTAPTGTTTGGGASSPSPSSKNAAGKSVIVSLPVALGALALVAGLM